MVLPKSWADSTALRSGSGRSCEARPRASWLRLRSRAEGRALLPEPKRLAPCKHRRTFLHEGRSGVLMIFREPRVHVMGSLKIHAAQSIDALSRTIEVFLHVAVGRRRAGGEAPRER